MKVKCIVKKRFNKFEPGTEITAPSQRQAESWAAYGYVEILKDKPAPKTKVIEGPEVKK